MPAYKHPCPYCGKFIDGGSVACPFCGVTEPFTHGRCPDCRANLQPGWIACPKCGRTLTSADTISPAAIGATGSELGTAPTTMAPTAPATSAASGGNTTGPAAANSTRCAGCGAALAPGARFCTECGTLVAG